eukprot:520124-Alexandrium_andersonii.AAC.1
MDYNGIAGSRRAGFRGRGTPKIQVKLPSWAQPIEVDKEAMASAAVGAKLPLHGAVLLCHRALAHLAALARTERPARNELWTDNTLSAYSLALKRMAHTCMSD